MKGLIEGRIVHFVSKDGKHRPAVITHVWGENGTVNLYVFPDPSHPMIESEAPTSVIYDEKNKGSYSWHWIEKA